MPRPRGATYPYSFDRDGRCLVRGRWLVRYPWARVLVEGYIGRELTSEEVVHHINGNPADDRIENLQILSPREHMALHRKELSEAMRKPRVSLLCATCGGAFERLPTRLNGAGYCSRECAYAGLRVAQCRHGHPRTPENTHVRSNGRTECLVCLRERSRRLRADARKATA